MDQQEIIAEATRCLIAFYQPDYIYLFGSEARGEAGPDSDLDFLVVVPDSTPEYVFRSNDIYSACWAGNAEGCGPVASERFR